MDRPKDQIDEKDEEEDEEEHTKGMLASPLVLIDQGGGDWN